MMIKRIKRNMMGSLLCLLLALVLALPAAAAGLHTLTVRYGWSGVDFDLYQVGAPDGNSWTLTGQFDGYSVKLPERGDSAEVWRNAAATLAAYASLDGLTPDDTQTISGGEARFSGLTSGLYLVVGEEHTQGNTTYTPVPALIAVEDDLTVQMKSDEETTPPDPGGGDDDVTYRVVKVWEGGEGERRESVTVQLIRNGQPDRTVTLSDANSWSYSWTSSPNTNWQVAELDVPDGFVVSVDRENRVFTVTNTYEEEIPDEPTPGGGDPDEPDNPDEPGEPDEPDIPDEPVPGGPGEPGEPGEPNLPQTGQLWWPVPVLLCAGAGFLIADRVFSRRKDKPNDT